MSRRRFLEEHDSPEISELMAFDMLKDDDYRERLEAAEMTPEELSRKAREQSGWTG